MNKDTNQIMAHISAYRMSGLGNNFLIIDRRQDSLEISKNKIDLITTFILKTAIIESECLIRFIKLIFDGPKYLVPLIDGTVVLSFATLVKDPEKLAHVAFSLIIFSTTDFGKQV